MALQLSELPDHPGLIAASKIGVFVTGASSSSILAAPSNLYGSQAY